MIEKFKARLNGNIDFKEILTGSAITFILKISGMLLGYIIILIISRKYGAEGIGIYSLTFSLMTFIAIIASMGINISILRYVGQFNKINEDYKLKLLYRYAIELSIPFSLLLALLLYNFSDFIALKLLNNIVYKSPIEFISIIIPFLAIQNINIEFIRGLKQLKISEFLRSVNQPLISIILLLTIGLYTVNPLLPLYTLGAGITIGSIYSSYFIFRKMQKIESKKHNSFLKKELFLTSIPMMITVIASFVMGNISLFMLELFATTSEVGIFSVSLKIATLISLVLSVVNTISAPKFSELYWAEKYDELQKVINISIQLVFFSSLFISTILILYREPILLIFGKEFIVGSSILILLIFAQMINATTGSVSILLNMTGNQNALKDIIGISTIITIILNYILILNYGLMGAAYSFLIGMSLLNISAAIYAKRKLGFTTYYNPLKFLSKRNQNEN